MNEREKVQVTTGYRSDKILGKSHVGRRKTSWRKKYITGMIVYQLTYSG